MSFVHSLSKLQKGFEIAIRFFFNNEVEEIVHGRHIQALMDDQNINSEVIDYYINMLNSKMKYPSKTHYYGKKH
ncbi:hypothetical protein C5167_034773 [Papaver somniferum]|uniref:Uncharacterized protein n=1 Tax=Papaver somniferum TaxID=3469 RepID=A0A4Y7KDX6_PAPSO|nr:hypothetical protein C5167_034773 [Papaver somniferum]